MTSEVLMDCKGLGINRQPFGIEHALALLQYQSVKGFTDWELSPKQGYTFKDGTISRTNKGANKEPDQPDTDTGSEGT
jgi:hypothetical protein